MSSFGDDESLSQCGSTHSSLMDDDVDTYGKLLRGAEYLSNVDYSLNSPLIGDEIDEFINYLNGKPYRDSWDMKSWRERKSVLVDSKIHKQFPNSTNFHKWFGTKNLGSNFKGDKIHSLLSEAQKDSDATFGVLKAFVKGWCGKDVENPRKDNCPDQIKKWGAYFIDLHVVTLILNSSDLSENEELLKLSGVRRHSTKHHDILTYKSENFGRVYIVSGFCFFVDESIIMDRNTLLMCKDTYIARFQTLFSLVNRVDDEFEQGDWIILSKIYEAGDKLLSRYGNAGYDGIKLVEPMATLRISQLARDHRPLIPEFTAFKDHVEESVRVLNASLAGLLALSQLIRNLQRPEITLVVFGSFRHWGHPYINYLTGLKKLEEQVNMPKNIDVRYADALGSDLAFIVLEGKFRETKQWYVHKERIQNSHPLYKHIVENTWPTPKQIADFGDNWNKLPLKACFDVPDMLDPSIIYSDKSHSLNRSEILNSVRKDPNHPIPSRKVLETLLKSKATNWKEFLQRINEFGLSKESLAIGLKGKERELKLFGRFFSLMTWELREYFVVTEYLIKTHFVPLFKGLTMADDLNTVLKKLMDNSSGQGNEDYENICIANHIDYTKWNNHQRDEANHPVFEVMDKFLGFTNLISRTHEFFKSSLIYYNGRPDLMRVQGDSLENRTDQRVCWEGQDGGLEGLRQKGWSVVNLLVIRRESANRNTKTTILAQGDNQVICGQYKLQKTRNTHETNEAIRGIIRENNNIMRGIERGTSKLGLIINHDETLQSADYLVYGKVPIYRGSIRGLETKRWSRVTCVTNDQLPTLANTMSSISSNALTVAHFSNSPMNAMVHYNFLGNFGRIVLEIHNPAVKSKLGTKVSQPHVLNSPEYKSLVLYLDPCLGGACGVSLSRFQVRGFTDPVTESLVFWRLVYHNGGPDVKQLAIKAGNPTLGPCNTIAFKKLLEDPSSLNIKGSVNPNSMIKEEIKNTLIGESERIKNDIMKSSLRFLKHNEDRVYEYMRSVKPLFPRFLSEYLSATYLGIVQSLVGLFQNSKTIRTVFTKRIDKKIKKLIVSSEVQTVNHLLTLAKLPEIRPIWRCSSTHADKLRFQSWGAKVHGATVPHPAELLEFPIKQGLPCPSCEKAPPESYYISTLVPQGLNRYKEVRGPYKAYMGSKTSETTSILQQWERETKIPLIKRATKLRSAIGWFIQPDSNLSKGILQNIESLTGEKWDHKVEGAKRTGSALHRFACSRQSSAGYAAQSPSKLTWMCTTTDTLSTLNSVNHDFMHQSLLIYAQSTVSEIMDGNPNQGFFHHHIACTECLREIEEINLDTDLDFNHEDVSHVVAKWKPDDTPWYQSLPIKNIAPGNWERLRPQEQSHHVGVACGFLYGDLKMSNDSRCDDSSIFPLSIQKKVMPRYFMAGLLEGLVRASSIHCISRRSVSELKRPREALLGAGLGLINWVSKHPSLISLWRSEGFENLFLEIPYKVPPSYPMSNNDLGLLGRSYLRLIYWTTYVQSDRFLFKYRLIWIFADINDVKLFGMLALSTSLVKTLYANRYNDKTKRMIRHAKDKIIALKDSSSNKSRIDIPLNNLRRTTEEIRHACKCIIKEAPVSNRDGLKWGKELTVDIEVTTVNYVSKSQSESLQETNEFPTVRRVQNPLISGMRLFQMATGSHYKIRSIIHGLQIKFQDCLAGGDGSGGIGSYLLRSNPVTRLIFNSLLTLEEVDLRGTSPSPPSAIKALGATSRRCVNLNDVWENPSDLSQPETWEYFMRLKAKFQLSIDLIVLDVESNSVDVSKGIETQVQEFAFRLLEHHGCLIYKTYLNRLFESDSILFHKIGIQFKDVRVVTTDISSSQTSEVYVVMSGFENQSRNLTPDLQSLWVTSCGFPSGRLLSDEFERALRLKGMNMYQGVPKILETDPIDDLGTLLEGLGVEVGVSAVLCELCKKYKFEIGDVLPLLILTTALNSILGLTAMHNKVPKPPSDGKVYNVGVLIVGFLNWMSLCQESLIIHKNATMMITQQFTISWEVKRVKLSKRRKRDNSQIEDFKYFLKYSLTDIYPKKKVFHLDALLSKIGSLQRCLARLFGYPLLNPDPKKLEDSMAIFSDSLKISTFNSRIDLFNAMKEEQAICVDSVNTMILQPNSENDPSRSTWED